MSRDILYNKGSNMMLYDEGSMRDPRRRLRVPWELDQCEASFLSLACVDREGAEPWVRAATPGGYSTGTDATPPTPRLQRGTGKRSGQP